MKQKACTQNTTETGILPDPFQQQAIRHTDGPCAVIAGPGSGKTAVITRRVAGLIACGVPPGNILTITFTKAAAHEMQSRFLKLTASRFQEAAFGTFHSVFYQIMAHSGFADRVRFIGVSEKKRMMEQALKQHSLRFSNEITESLLRAVSAVKNLGCTNSESLPVSEALPFADHFQELFHTYEEIRRSLNRMDFDDIAPECLKLLQNNPALLARWQNRFRYIQIDEFQDVNPVQYALAGLIAKKSGNLFAVGDDDQSVYGFRGATPDVFRRFLSDYPQAKQIVLQTNFRSSRAVIRASSKVISGNRNRLSKTVLPAKAAAEGTCRLLVCPDRNREMETLVQTIRQKTGEGIPYESIAVLFRTAADAMRVVPVLTQSGIPFRMTEKLPVPFTETAAEDVLAYLRFSTAGYARADFLRILNKPVRYLSRSCAASGTVRESDVLQYYADSPSAQKKVTRLFLDCHRIANLKPHLAIGYVLQGTGYERYLEKENDAAGFAKAREVLYRLRDLAKEHTDTRSFLEHIRNMREATEACARQTNLRTGAARGVRLMTMHAAKGLEFDAVFLPFLNEGILPQIRAVTDAETEEERRLLYVAMTRAKNSLYLSCAERDGMKQLLKSRFIG